MQQSSSNVVHLYSPGLLGEPYQEFTHINDDWMGVPNTAAKIRPQFTVWISKAAWNLILPDVKNELEVFGKTRNILFHIVSFGTSIADVLKPGWEVPILAGYLDGEQLFLRCIRFNEGFYLDL